MLEPPSYSKVLGPRITSSTWCFQMDHSGIFPELTFGLHRFGAGFRGGEGREGLSQEMPQFSSGPRKAKVADLGPHFGQPMGWPAPSRISAT